MTSSMPAPRIDLGELSPITQRIASSTLDLPQPFGPTTPVRPGSIAQLGRLDEALEAESLSRFICTVAAPRLLALAAGRRSSGSSAAQSCDVGDLRPLMKKVGVPVTPTGCWPRWPSASSRSSAGLVGQAGCACAGGDAVPRGDLRRARSIGDDAAHAAPAARWLDLPALRLGVSACDPADPLVLGRVELVGSCGR